MCKVVPHSEDHPKVDRFRIRPKITFGKSIHTHLPASIEYIPSENALCFAQCLGSLFFLRATEQKKIPKEGFSAFLLLMKCASSWPKFTVCCL